MELLAPAGNFEKLQSALHFGADAVYLAGKSYGLRAYAGNFSDKELEEAVKLAHSLKKKVYITLNIVARDSDFEGIDNYLEFLEKLKVDALIVSDIGLIYYIRKKFPNLTLHVSTQANITNSFSGKLLAELGVKRLILARELSLDEIAQIRKNLPKKIELEVFVHGAMCMAYSGRCLLSNYLTGRDSNHGECVQACRWKYMVREVSRDDELEVTEDEKGTYIFNSKDLCMIEHLKELEEIGIDSIKIEGRMKSAYYVATVTHAYRVALDNLDKKVNKNIISELGKVSHRRYTTGFYFKNNESREYLLDSTPVQESEFVAVVIRAGDGKTVEVEMRNKFEVGQELEILSKNDNFFLKKLKISDIFDENGEKISTCQKVQQHVVLSCEYPLEVGDILRR